jgi:hypothetical protein
METNMVELRDGQADSEGSAFAISSVMREGKTQIGSVKATERDLDVEIRQHADPANTLVFDWRLAGSGLEAIGLKFDLWEVRNAEERVGTYMALVSTPWWDIEMAECIEGDYKTVLLKLEDGQERQKLMWVVKIHPTRVSLPSGKLPPGLKASEEPFSVLPRASFVLLPFWPSPEFYVFHISLY